MGSRFQNLYFDWVYTPVYDFTVAQLEAYRRLQSASLDRLSLRDRCMVLSVGTGTGNELLRLIQRNGATNWSLVAVDLSRRSLSIAGRKARRSGKAVAVLQMDAQHLGFADGQFDRVVCLHTMDFLKDTKAATWELLRVLKKGGEFVITYPLGEGIGGLAGAVARSVGRKLRRGALASALKEVGVSLGAAVAYAPLAMSAKPQRLLYARQDLEGLLDSMEISEYEIEEDHIYRDFIVWGAR